MTNEKWKIAFYGEEDFAARMKGSVTPWLYQNVVSGTTLSLDGVRLQYYYALNPERGKTVTFVHGFGEFFGKYHEVMHLFYQAGYSVFFLELRGFGRSQRLVSDPDLIHVNSFNEYLDDVFAFQYQIVQPLIRGDVHILFGHSMGGCISTLFLERYPKFFDKAILSSPMLELDFRTSDWKLQALSMISTAPNLNAKPSPSFRPFNPKPDFAHSSCASEPRYMYQFSQRLASDKYHTSGSSYGWTRAAYAAMQEAIAYAGDIRIPLLILQAENDHLVLPGGQRQVAQRARNAAIMKIPGSKHEIFNATTEARELYWQVIFTFLETPVSEIPAAG